MPVKELRLLPHIKGYRKAETALRRDGFYSRTYLEDRRPFHARFLTTDSSTDRDLPASERYKMAKPFSAIPGPRGLPLVGTLFSALRHGAFNNNLHGVFRLRYLKYGAIYREKIGSYAAVYIHDPDDIQEFFKHEARHPTRTDFEAWNLYRRLAGRDTGVLLSNGEAWQKHRSALNHHMMRPLSVAGHLPDIETATDDFIRALQDRLAASPQHRTAQLSDLLFRWSMESACMVLFDKRLGILSPGEPTDDIMAFIGGVHAVLRTTERLLLTPPHLARALGLAVWKDMYNGWDTMFNIGEKYITATLSDVGQRLSDGEDAGRGLIRNLLQSGKLSRQEILSSLLDLMTGAVDTTSNCLLWSLYSLAINPRVQKALHDEVERVLPPPGVPLKQEHLNEMHYLKAVIKETLRLYPVAPAVSRIVDKDIVLRNYKIPSGTLVNVSLWPMGRSEDLFTDPETFAPERWLRDGATGPQTINPFASLPFGFGPRSCIGRRVAELEMHVLLSKLLQMYYVDLGREDKRVAAQMRVLIVPSETINFRLTERNPSSKDKMAATQVL